jgi:hypothetical protein
MPNITFYEYTVFKNNILRDTSTYIVGYALSLLASRQYRHLPVRSKNITAICMMIIMIMIKKE